MFTRKPCVLLAGTLALALTLAPSRAKASGWLPDPDAPPPRRTGMAGDSWFRGGSAERCTPERTHFFLAGGFAFITTQSLVNAWLLDGWNATGGLEVPVGRTWTLVPRVHFLGASGDNSSNILWGRLALDGRLSTTRGGLLNYYEAGLGLGVIDTPVSVTDAHFNSHFERRTSGTPFFQIVTGLRGDPDQAPAFMTELIIAMGLGAEHPGTLEWVVGIEF